GGPLVLPESSACGCVCLGVLPEMSDGGIGGPGGMPEMSENNSESGGQGGMPEMSENNSESGGQGGGPGGGGGGMGGNDSVALVYQDDDIDSYSSIFNYSVFKPDYADKKRLIKSIKQLNEGENLEEVVNIDEVLSYFVAHNFVVNFDSYTGSMMHNYYLYEDDGQLSMIAWDYNLAFGGFSGGGGGGKDSSSGDSATEAVNYPIDTPLSGAEMEDRPMIGKLLENEEYLERYHELFDEFIANYFESGDFEDEYYRVYNMILEYVAKDPTKFCTLDEFVTGADTLRQFCNLRAESVRGQLNGTIPSTSDGQAEDSSSLIDASFISISDMGSMNAGGGGMGDRGGSGDADSGGESPGEVNAPDENAAPSENDNSGESSDSAERSGNSRSGEFNIDTLSEMLGMDVSELEAMTQDEIRELLQEKINNGELNLSPRGNNVMEEERDMVETYALLGGSVLLLLIGIFAAFLFKRRRK
ncbi:MAG: CotH kinase family protein, partial [Oscillospiraceae bacterium]|nr:CotH kinase family protein [Oscillospiraceae bacterium]